MNKRISVRAEVTINEIFHAVGLLSNYATLIHNHLQDLPADERGFYRLEKQGAELIARKLKVKELAAQKKYFALKGKK